MYTTIKKRILVPSLCLLLLSLPSITGWAETRTHIVQRGETLYRLSKMYNVTQVAIQEANQGIIEGTNIPAGATIVIPDSISEPIPVGLKPLSPMRSVAQKVNKWVGEKLEAVAVKLEEGKAELADKPATISIILPFHLASHSSAEDKMQMRSVEFYQGVLVAVNRAQLNGMKVKLNVYDLGTEPLARILEHEELATSDLIIAPMEPSEIRQVALYGEEHGINVINPFKLVPDLANSCTHLFQLNTYIADLYPELAADLKERFSDHAFVFISDSAFVEKTDPFANYLKEDLKVAGIPCFEFTYGNPESVLAVDSALNLLQSNIFFVPVTNQRDALRRFFPTLKNKVFLDAHPEVAEAALASSMSSEDYENLKKEREEKAKAERKRKIELGIDVDAPVEPRKIAILGYPEWQLYTQDFMEHFYDMNVWMFCKFYVDPFDSEVTEMYSQFRYWYAREMLDLYPKYGMLGYDVTAYGLQMIGNYGHDFAPYADGKYIKTLQNAMLFRREGEGGYVNKGLYLVHFTPESHIEKYEIK